ncbi:MAG: type 1 glutamine amidotransferase family protein [Syntrophales bacterium]
MKKVVVVILIVLAVLELGTWLFLPAGLRAVGLHPEYAGQKYQLPGGKALIITTSHDRLGENGKKTGVFGSEMTVPYYEFADGGMTVDLASVRGGEIPIDPLSFKWPMETAADDRFLNDSEFQRKVKQSLLIILRDVNKKYGRLNLAKIMNDIMDYHTFTEDAARIADKAGVRHLLLTHILPPLPVADLKEAFLGDFEKFYRRPITIGEDGIALSLPAGTGEIIKRMLL